MPVDHELADRLRAALGAAPGVTEARLFGGAAFLVDGHMAVCASGQGDLLVRVDRDAAHQLVGRDGAAPMEMRGRPVAGWLRVATAAVATPAVLGEWVERGVACARSLPPKR